MKEKKTKNNKLLFVIYPVCILFIVIIVLSILNLILSDKKIFLKNFDLNKIISENLLFSHEIGNLSNDIENVLTEDYINGIYNNGDRLLQKSNITYKNDDLPELLENISAQYEVPAYVSLVPDVGTIYKDSLPDSAYVSSSDEVVDEFYSEFTEIKPIDLYNTLKSQDEAYIYYRTENMWTSYGAYCGYSRIINRLGYAPISFSSYKITHIYSDYVGELSKIYGSEKSFSDYIDKYEIIKGSKILNMTTSDNRTEPENTFFDESYINSDNSSEMLKYYLGEKTGLISIKTNCESDKTLLLFKDDFANEMIVFLLQHYSYIYICDTKIMTQNDIEEIKSLEPTEILFLYGYDVLTDSNKTKSLENF